LVDYRSARKLSVLYYSCLDKTSNVASHRCIPFGTVSVGSQIVAICVHPSVLQAGVDPSIVVKAYRQVAIVCICKPPHRAAL